MSPLTVTWINIQQYISLGAYDSAKRRNYTSPHHTQYAMLTGQMVLVPHHTHYTMLTVQRVLVPHLHYSMLTVPYK